MKLFFLKKHNYSQLEAVGILWTQAVKLSLSGAHGHDLLAKWEKNKKT